jgi:hypothetical protein
MESQSWETGWIALLNLELTLIADPAETLCTVL